MIGDDFHPESEIISSSLNDAWRDAHTGDSGVYTLQNHMVDLRANVPTNNEFNSLTPLSDSFSDEGMSLTIINQSFFFCTFSYSRLADKYMREPRLMKLNTMKRDQNYLSSDVVSITLAEFVTSSHPSLK
jgi:hypothetical protein